MLQGSYSASILSAGFKESRSRFKGFSVCGPLFYLPNVQESQLSRRGKVFPVVNSSFDVFFKCNDIAAIPNQMALFMLMILQLSSL